MGFCPDLFTRNGNRLFIPIWQCRAVKMGVYPYLRTQKLS
jgi:hypothetical protein